MTEETKQKVKAIKRRQWRLVRIILGVTVALMLLPFAIFQYAPEVVSKYYMLFLMAYMVWPFAGLVYFSTRDWDWPQEYWDRLLHKAVVNAHIPLGGTLPPEYREYIMKDLGRWTPEEPYGSVHDMQEWLRNAMSDKLIELKEKMQEQDANERRE